MKILAGILGAALVLLVLAEGFETIILPRRITRQFRLTRMFYLYSWRPWRTAARLLRKPRSRETWLSWYGPLSLIGLLCLWALALIVGFTLMQWAAGSEMVVAGDQRGFWIDLYMSGTTFFTLGLGDVAPRSALARLLTVIEGGTGFGFLAGVISYLPTLYGAFSRREVDIALLDARAGSPPSAGELLRRHAHDGGTECLLDLLREWERWSAETLESHLSYPVLCYYRSQHDNQSWLSALTTILDTCALIMVGIDRIGPRQAELTFAISRHAVVDLAQVFRSSPHNPPHDRLPPEDLAHLRSQLAQLRLPLNDGPEAHARLSELRSLYEPFVYALAGHMSLRLPRWMPTKEQRDNWQTSAWGRIRGVSVADHTDGVVDEHF
jgi:hypothetical protein